MLCIFGDQIFVPTSSACKKRTAVSDSSTEAEVVSQDTRLRMEGFLALKLWDAMIDVLESLAKGTSTFATCTISN